MRSGIGDMASNQIDHISAFSKLPFIAVVQRSKRFRDRGSPGPAGPTWNKRRNDAVISELRKSADGGGA